MTDHFSYICNGAIFSILFLLLWWIPREPFINCNTKSFLFSLWFNFWNKIAMTELGPDLMWYTTLLYIQEELFTSENFIEAGALMFIITTKQKIFKKWNFKEFVIAEVKESRNFGRRGTLNNQFFIVTRRKWIWNLFLFLYKYKQRESRNRGGDIILYEDTNLKLTSSKNLKYLILYNRVHNHQGIPGKIKG